MAQRRIERIETIELCAFVAVVLAACGGGGKNGAGGTSTSPTSAVTTSSAGSAPTSDDAADEGISPISKKAAADESLTPSKAPPPSSDGLISLETVQGKPAAGADFPAKKTTDAACIGDISLGGKSTADYEDVGKKCGTATGMKPFTKPVSGKLGPSHTRDVYTFTMLGGLCYRFFAVGDDSLSNVNIRVETMTGAFLSMDSTKQPFAVLDPDAAWCKTHDRQFRFVVETTGKSDGNYVFGVWARPK
jgi:hypothetical protein